MKHVAIRLAALVLLPVGMASAWEFTAEVGAEQRVFTEDAVYGPDYDTSVSGYLEPELYHSWNDDRDSFTFVPFGRVDERDDERTHADIRELHWIHVGESNWELRTGIRIDFWGMTESQHLVDIINQTDLVENVDGEDKLGQPMINLSIERSWGILDLYVLPGFRERTFAGEDARLRGPFLIDTDEALYESSEEHRHVDAAIRWKQYFGPFDIAISHFSGTSRDPRFVFAETLWLTNPNLPNDQINLDGDEFIDANDPNNRLVPVYDQIDQTGLEMQLILGGWAWKFEGITRHGQCWSSQLLAIGPLSPLSAPKPEFCDDTYSAATFGFEFTQTGIFGTRTDLGWVVESLFDDRGDEAPAGANEHDMLFATRWAVNDAGGTEALIGVVWDYETEERAFSVEASRRFSDDIKVSIEGRWFSNTGEPSDLLFLFVPPSPEEKLGVFADKDFAQINFHYYF